MARRAQELEIDSQGTGANLYCSKTTAGMRNIKPSHSKVLVADKSKASAQ
jgi:hypothetical protein